MTADGTLLTIDLGAVAANYRLLRDKAGTASAAVVKADGYGLGAERVADCLEKEGCRDFFVATVEEGIRLRKATTQNIYVFGGLHSGDRETIEYHTLIPVLNSLPDIQSWSGDCAVHFDTGMNRLGLSADETRRVMDDPSLLKNLTVRAALSHFVASEDKASPLNHIQCDAFAQIHARLNAFVPEAKWSLCNSSGIFGTPQAAYDLVRPGIALYGGNPTPDAPNPMRATVVLDAAVLQIRDVKAGETVGYNATYTFPTDTQTATICLGYADGFLRSTKGVVYWQGQPCPIRGRISMDAVSVEIGHLGQKPAPGDRVEVIGPNQSVDDLAAAAGTISYEILTSLGGRYARLYKEVP